MELRALVEGARAGDVAAFTELVQRYQDMAFGYAFSILRDFHLAQDAAQEAFVAAYFGLGTLSRAEQFPQWLRGIARNQCLRLLRGRRVATASLDAACEVAATEAGPERRAEERDGLGRVLAAIDALPPEQREVTALFYVGERSQREVAAFLGLPVTTVNNRLHAARKRLKGELLAMTEDALKKNGLPQDFAARVGRIVRARGAVVEARFAPDALPPVLTTLTVTGAGGGGDLTVQVAQHLGDGVVRGIALSAGDGGGLAAGVQIVSTGRPVERAVERAQVLEAVAALGRAAATGAPALLETGLKAIDLFCPLATNSAIGIVGDMGAGKMVLVDELAHNLADAWGGIALFSFIQPGAEVALLQGAFPPGYDFTRVAIVPVDDPRAMLDEQPSAALDTVLFISRDLATAGLFPAIDPLRSTSRFLDPAFVGREHYEVAGEARALLRRAEGLRAGGAEGYSEEEQAVVRRAGLLRHYLSQPMFVAEAFTGVPGRFVGREQTVADCKALLSGAHDDLPEAALLRKGTLAQALEEARG